MPYSEAGPGLPEISPEVSVSLQSTDTRTRGVTGDAGGKSVKDQYVVEDMKGSHHKIMEQHRFIKI